MAKDANFGDWAKATKILARAADRHRIAVDKAMLREAHYLRTHLVKGMAGGSPGGMPYRPLAPLTLLLRKVAGFGGTKPLNRTGALRGSISVHKDGDNYFVGILRSARAKDGKSLVNIGVVHEFGAEVPITAKSRRWLWWMLKQHGLVHPGGGGYSKGKHSFRIPPRPTFGPVFDVYAKPADVKRRFIANLAQLLGYDFGKP